MASHVSVLVNLLVAAAAKQIVTLDTLDRGVVVTHEAPRQRGILVVVVAVQLTMLMAVVARLSGGGGRRRVRRHPPV